jgi:predicted transcriptional regulator
MIELTKAEDRLFKLIQSGINTTDALADYQDCNKSTILTLIKPLREKGMIVTPRVGNRLLIIPEPKSYTVVSRTTVTKKVRSEGRFRILRKLVKAYGADNVRYVELRRNEPSEELAQKIGVKMRDVLKIKTLLGA